MNGIWKAAGLVSWGIGCGKVGLPGVYVNTGYYENWIRETILSNSANEFDKTDESEEFNYGQSGRVVNDMNSATNSMISSNSMATSSNNNQDESNENNNLYEPASVINERSLNSQFINGTESDEMTISLPQASTNLNKNTTASSH